MHTNQHLHFHHPTHVKRGVVRCLDRIRGVINTQDNPLRTFTLSEAASCHIYWQDLSRNPASKAKCMICVAPQACPPYSLLVDVGIKALCASLRLYYRSILVLWVYCTPVFFFLLISISAIVATLCNFCIVLKNSCMWWCYGPCRPPQA